MQAYRPDIDGLRAIAVTSVVLYHALPTLVPSGFVGVDIFFVISGYLIGGIIYSGATGKGFSFLNFYARRARRILPALLVVVLATLAAGFVLLSSEPFLELTAQAISALVGMSNIYFWDSTDYFADASIFKPLMMTWSLGVEEQFYVFFPFVVLALLKAPARWHVGLMALLALGSLVYSIYATTAQPLAAFYLMPSRAWELAAGAALAIANRQGILPRLSLGLENLLALLGFALTIGALFMFSHDTPFPGSAALVPVIGTLLLIYARESLINVRILAAAPFVFIGLISYSWYLWHWPVMSYIHIVADFQPRPQVLLVAVVISFVLAVLSWKYVEQPFRKSGARPRTTLLRYGAALSLALAVPVGLRLTDGMPARLPQAVHTAEAILDEGWGTCIALVGRAAPLDVARCHPPGARIALFGDSHASAAGPGLVDYARNQGTELAQYSKAACAPLLGYARVQNDNRDHARSCAQFMEKHSLAIAADPDIEIVVIAGFWPFLGEQQVRPYSGDQFERPIEAIEALEPGLRNSTERFLAAGKKVVIVGDIPRFDFNPMRRVIGDHLPIRAALRRMIDPDYDIDKEFVARKPDTELYTRSRQTVASVAADYPGVTYIDLEAQLCAEGRCRFQLDGKPLMFDYHHLSAFGSRQIDWSSALGPLLAATSLPPSRNETP